MQRRQKSTRAKNAKASVSMVEQNTQNSTNLENVMAVIHDDVTSTEVQKIEEVPTNNHVSKDNKIVNNCSDLELKSNAPAIVDTKANNTNRVAAKSKRLLNSDNHVKESEVDVKMDSEDTKASSSSENSNDSRVLDFNADNKSTLNQINDTDNKPGFRSRSGSTDTTGSESGSNSGVRRSNRIRSIGLMKQRSRGRGLVTKPIADQIKTISQTNQDKIVKSVISEKECQNKDNPENTTETQSDKENNSKSVSTISQDGLLASANTPGMAGYDSDSNKPVKVKSRWRLSSELEMSNSGSWAMPQPNSGHSNASSTEFSTGPAPTLVNDYGVKLSSLSSELPQDPNIQDMVNALSLKSNENLLSVNSATLDSNLTSNESNTVTPISVGTKISLPMIQETADREMEERLSQFEHLKESLYFTERYINKDTKRMVCDCFLTEEEIQRGELGCGEDCLNRLLMIECGSRCVVADRCTNKRFQNCEYSNCEVFRTEKKGFGLRATTDLVAGDFIMEYVGEVVNPKDFRKRAKEYSKDKNRHYYFMALKSDQIIDATNKGNISRFINHSCDPNAETQKWTVNGELRIGFFIKKYVAAGEEITFDYHFQRYGKEAQKCFCEAENCRGWIGDNPDDNKDKTEGEEEMEEDETESSEESEDEVENKENKEELKPKKQVRRKKREEKKVPDHMEDEDLEEQIDKLCSTGLKNRTHTLTLSRLMVRSTEIQYRTRLLKVIQSGEQPCRRLFLDYHGLRLMWSYMMDLGTNTNEEAQQFRIEVLKTLATLPIPNRTMLIDSRVLDVVEKWSKHLYQPESGESPEDDQSKLKSINEDVEMDIVEKSDLESNKNENDKETESEVKKEIKVEDADLRLISELADNLLAAWSTLKEVFRIPKKERIEQMKEHEREADREYKENEEADGDSKDSSYDKFRSDRYSRSELEKRRRGKDSPEFEYGRSKDKKGLEERSNLVPVPQMSKFERRQLFAMKVAKEEEERQRRQQEELWHQHEAQCLALGLDPCTTAAFDSQTGYPLFFNPQVGQWQPYPMQPPAEGQELVPSYAPPAGLIPAELATTVYSMVQKNTTAFAGTPPIQVQNGTPYANDNKSSSPDRSPPPAPPPPLDLPPKWKWARDKRGRIYYYQIKERISQWLPPPPDHIAVQPDSSSMSESSDESSEESDEDDTELEDQPLDSEMIEQQQLDEIGIADVSISSIVPAVEGKKRRDGLVQERIISPRREEDRIDHKKYKETKEKLRRLKERNKLKEHFDKMKKHRRSGKSKSHAKHSTKIQITSDMSPTTERRIKDTFRINMANVMVQFLNPYRKNDCKQGRITNTEDFKHLARKLTHFVLAKELKHCKSVDELECNENVKHKAKDFVRKYMNKFGAVYQKGSDED